MRIRRGAAVAGITMGSIGGLLATAGTALAVPAPPTRPVVTGVITGPHTFALTRGEVVVVGEKLHPNAPSYDANVPVTAVRTVKGVTTVTVGYTFLPLNRIGKVTTFTVLPRSRARGRHSHSALTVTAVTGVSSVVLTGHDLTCGC